MNNIGLCQTLLDSLSRHGHVNRCLAVVLDGALVDEWTAGERRTGESQEDESKNKTKHSFSSLQSRKLWKTQTQSESSTFWWKREVCWLWNPIRKSVFGAKLGCCLLVCVRSLWTLFKVKTGHAWPSDLCVCVSTGPNQGWMATCTRASAWAWEAGVSQRLKWLRLNGMWPSFHLAAAYLILSTEICISAGQMWPVSLCGNPQFRQTSDWLIILSRRLCTPAHPLHVCTLQVFCVTEEQMCILLGKWEDFLF